MLLGDGTYDILVLGIWGKLILIFGGLGAGTTRSTMTTAKKDLQSQYLTIDSTRKL